MDRAQAKHPAPTRRHSGALSRNRMKSTAWPCPTSGKPLARSGRLSPVSVPSVLPRCMALGKVENPGRLPEYGGCNAAADLDHSWARGLPDNCPEVLRGGGLPSARKTSTKVSSRGDYLSRIAQLDQRTPSRTMSAIGGSGRAATKEEVRVWVGFRMPAA